MLKLVVLSIIMAMAASSALKLPVPNQRTVYIIYDPKVNSIKKGIQVCSYSSPSWVNSFSHPRLGIESTFEELTKSTQNPTIQKSFKIVFKRPLGRRSLYLNNYASYQEYTGRNTDLGFQGVFDSGLSYIPGWLKIESATQSYLRIIDYSTATIISVYRLQNSYYGQKWFNLYVNSYQSFLSQGTGIMVDGCSNNIVFPWQSNFAANPNLGRRKRATKECEEVAKAYVERFPNHPDFSYDNVLSTCEEALKLDANTPKIMLDSLQTLAETDQIFQKTFPPEYVYNADEAEAILEKEQQSIQEQLEKAAFNQ